MAHLDDEASYLDLDRQRLPTLIEVLSRRTLAPVDLFSFYIYMRDQQRSVDYLDFWLDVSQHMSLCRHYVRELRRSVLFETPEFAAKSGSKRSSQVLDNFDLNDHDSTHSSSRSRRDQRVSQFLRHDDGSNHSHKPSGDSGESRDSTPSGRGDQPRPSYMASERLRNPDSNEESTPQHTVARADIRASAEKILYTYLLAQSEREIILPQAILNEITESIEEQGRDDPEVFDAAKDYVFQAMERDAYPGFLRAKALGNLVPPSLMLRLILGLLAMFGAFWAAFCLIFLNYDRATRCWLILPFSVGVYTLGTHQYTLDPLMALFGYSEYTFASFARIREPYVRTLLNKRSLMLLGWIFLITAAWVILFVFVPGKRL